MATAYHVNYKKIYIALLVLLAISIIGPTIGIPWLTLITAFGIAIVKATLVVQNFMHLKWEQKIMKWVLLSSVVAVALFWAAVEQDIKSHRGANWVNDAAIEATRRGIQPPHGAPVHGADTAHADTARAGTSAHQPDSAKKAH